MACTKQAGSILYQPNKLSMGTPKCQSNFQGSCCTYICVQNNNEIKMASTQMSLAMKKREYMTHNQNSV